MTEDVSTTPRKPLTPRQRLKMFEAHAGLCVLCKGKITDAAWIDEHVIPLNLGGSNDLSNRGPAHKVCADAKTHGKDGDIAKGAKAKRQKIAAVVGKAEPVKKIESKGFPAKPKREPKPTLPPRALFH
jgi:5-methylcytosine-specific restriction protein A